MTIAPARPRRLPRATAIAIALLVISVLVSFLFVVEHGGLLLPEAAVPGASALAGAGAGGSPGAGIAGGAGGAGTGSGASAGGSGAASSAIAAGGGPAASGSAGASGSSGGTGGAGGSGGSGGSGASASSPAGTAGASAGGGAAASPARTPHPTVRPSPRPTIRPGATPVSGGNGSPSASRLALLTACVGRANCYVYVVRSGDNLFSIANYFGVPLARVRALNPALGNGSIVQPGSKLILPTPTR